MYTVLCQIEAQLKTDHNNLGRCQRHCATHFINRREIDEQWWASVFRFVRRQVEASLKTKSKKFRKKFEKLSERQDKLLGGQTERSVKMLDKKKLPGWVREVL